MGCIITTKGITPKIYVNNRVTPDSSVNCGGGNTSKVSPLLDAAAEESNSKVNVRENAVWKRTAPIGSKLKRGDYINNYLVVQSKPLGKGFQSVVYLVEDDGSGPRTGYHVGDKAGDLYAMKVLKLKRMAHAKKGRVAKGEKIEKKSEIASEEGIWAEIRVGRMTSHKNLTRLVEVIRCEETSEVILIMELEPNGIVLNKKKGETLPLRVAQKYFSDCIDGILYLHQNGIFHRDLKVENLLIGKGNIVKLADFGMAHITDPLVDPHGKGLKRGIGSRKYRAPEIFYAHENAPNGEYEGASADVWSIGCCLHCMCTGKLPFAHKDKNELARIVQFQPYMPENFPCINSHKLLKDLMCKMLEKNPHKRITIKEIKKHPWMHCDPENEP
eukprot:g4182.t1